MPRYAPAARAPPRAPAMRPSPSIGTSSVPAPRGLTITLTRTFRASDFEYDLPPSLIAQDPLPDRAGSRLLVLDRATGAIRHGRFGDVVDLIAPEDVLVLNVSRVIPARLRGTRENGSAAEVLLVRELSDGTWLAMAHPGGKLKPGRSVRFGD